ncbi:MAG: VCBS repeat-containing protein, partial [Saprospiraceae bacterium]|nr:VCBS repeat-containing protein [Saprospiraceae bacterium]
FAADLDGDLDLDLLSASQNDDRVAWYENLGGGSFGPQQTLPSFPDGASYVYAIDLDGDKDKDVLAAAWVGDKIYRFENDGMGNFSP